MKEIFFKSIETKRLIIREFLKKDYNDLYDILENYNVCKYLIYEPLKEKKEAKLFVRGIIDMYYLKTYYKLAIFLKSEKKVIGYVGLSKQDLSNTKCQIIYAINEKYWHQGYASEALDVFIEYLIKDENKTEIIAKHIERNVNSGLVMKKCGLQRDENLDSEMIIHGQKEKLIAYKLEVKKWKK